MSARLRRMLASRGVDPTLNDDIVQEVAVRALDKRVPFTDPDDLYRWAATAARRLHIDHLRSDCRMTGDDSLVSVADGTDVAHLVERRVALNHVWRALAGLRPGEQEAILESLEDREARSSGALVRRHRARASLKKAVGGAIAWAALVHLRLRELAQPVNATAAAAVLAPAIALGTAGVAATPPARPHVVAETSDTSPGMRSAVRPPAAPAKARRDGGTRATSGDIRPARGTEPADPDAPPEEKTQIGPIIEMEPDHDSEQESVFCLERHHEPFWCVPDLPPGPRM